MRNKLSFWKTISGTALAALAVFMIYGVFTLSPDEKEWWEKNSMRTRGTVIELKEAYRNKIYCDYPVIEFSADDGKKYSFSPVECYSKGVFTTGKPVAVRYKKNNPSMAFIDSPSHDRATNIAIYVFAVFLLFCGAALIVWGIKGSETEQV